MGGISVIFKSINLLFMLKDLLHFLFPKSCPGCSILLLTHEVLLCTVCRATLPFTHQHQSATNEALGKFYGKVKIQQASCLLYYAKGGLVSNLLHQLKYNNQPSIAFVLGQLYAELLADDQAFPSVDYIVSVPLHPKKLKQRGYNQVDGFATALSQHFQIPIHSSVLAKVERTASQTTKSFQERIKSKPAVFQLQSTPNLAGKHFLLLDDILTTGSTLENCAKLLLQIPDSKVSILCLAYTK
ncbi:MULTISPECIES: phosphoribosyltransferase family protein [unclassified Myroides]|uniref:ComF family protein n=1 Tax=unclassified Myroides TaxID=2642485 RepID=UPI002576ED9A|nr:MULTISPECIES: phosphoribosyltransferase family protein [unclassified Myroides]